MMGRGGGFLPTKQHSCPLRSRTMLVPGLTPSLPHHPPVQLEGRRTPGWPPSCGAELADLVSRLQSAYQLHLASSRKLLLFKSILLPHPLLVVETKAEEQEAQQLLISTFGGGLPWRARGKSCPRLTVEEQVRVCEMAAYTHCNLQPVHQIHFQDGAQPSSNSRILDSGSSPGEVARAGAKPEVAQQTRKILQACDKNPTDAHKLQL